ncbi:hypothetical protein [Streptomyces xanthophaeus]|uniref:hypothetical protein n=1 Tax=Streptomyces xanthophaeus TaxID=67385 RepID=UPI0036541A20
MNIGLSLAGAAVCAVILFLNLRRWWNGSRAPQDLANFGQGLLMGALATLCSGGLLGWLSGCTRQGVSAVGDKAISGVTGTSASTPLAANSLAGQLTGPGAIVVCFATAATIAAYKVAGKDDKKRLIGGLLCGLCLTITAGVAGALSDLPVLVNELGDAGKRIAEGGSL